MMDPNAVLVWVQIGTQLVQVARGPIGAVMEALRAPDIDADNAQLDKVNTLYDERIARAEREASGS